MRRGGDRARSLNADRDLRLINTEGRMVSVDIERVAAIIRQAAADEALPRWRNLGNGDIREKAGPDDLVTVADRAVEIVLSRQLTDLLPGSKVVGEEGVHADPRGMALFQTDAPIWVIDPIDGTSAFATGSPVRLRWSSHAWSSSGIDLVVLSGGAAGARSGSDMNAANTARPANPNRQNFIMGSGAGSIQ